MSNVCIRLVGLTAWLKIAAPCAGRSRTISVPHGRHFVRRVVGGQFATVTVLALLCSGIDRLDLPRIQDETELEALKADGSLLEIKAGETLRFDPRLDPSRRFCRSWTLDFVNDLGQAYYHRFHDQIQVNSAVRTVRVQKKLRRHNRNAAPADGDTASSHLAGVTLDLQRRGLNKEQVRWMEHYLFYMKSLGLVEPEEERRHWCFHIMVSGHYSEWRETQTIVPIERPEQEKPDAPQVPQPEVSSGGEAQ